MPVRSLNSSVLKWPDANSVDVAVRNWAANLVKRQKGILKIAYFGSYARGNWGVGSDLDVIVIVDQASESKERRGLKWDTFSIPVPVDLQILTESEWNAIPGAARFKETLQREAVWVYSKV